MQKICIQYSITIIKKKVGRKKKEKKKALGRDSLADAPVEEGQHRHDFSPPPPTLSQLRLTWNISSSSSSIPESEENDKK